MQLFQNMLTVKWKSNIKFWDVFVSVWLNVGHVWFTIVYNNWLVLLTFNYKKVLIFSSGGVFKRYQLTKLSINKTEHKICDQ